MLHYLFARLIVWMPLPWRPYSRFWAATPMAVPILTPVPTPIASQKAWPVAAEIAVPIPTPIPTPIATHAPMLIRGDLTHLTHLPDFPGVMPPL